MSRLHTKFNVVTILRNGSKFVSITQRWRSVYISKGRITRKGVAAVVATYTLRFVAKCVAAKRVAAKVAWFEARGYRVA
jgi:hypothetical protein